MSKAKEILEKLKDKVFMTEKKILRLNTHLKAYAILKEV